QNSAFGELPEPQYAIIPTSPSATFSSTTTFSSGYLCVLAGRRIYVQSVDDSSSHRNNRRDRGVCGQQCRADDAKRQLAALGDHQHRERWTTRRNNFWCAVDGTRRREQRSLRGERL